MSNDSRIIHSGQSDLHGTPVSIFLWKQQMGLQNNLSLN